MDWMDSITEWHEVLPESPDEEYPHTVGQISDYQEFEEWIGHGNRFIDRDDIPEHWLCFHDPA